MVSYSGNCWDHKFAAPSQPVATGCWAVTVWFNSMTGPWKNYAVGGAASFTVPYACATAWVEHNSQVDHYSGLERLEWEATVHGPGGYIVQRYGTITVDGIYNQTAQPVDHRKCNGQREAIMSDTSLSGWLPIGFTFEPADISVRWLQFGATSLAEPFFPQTIRQLRTMTPPARERVTDVSSLVAHARGLPPATPAAVIFHVSRCGSTFLANALGTGDRFVTLSEAKPISALMSLTLFRRAQLSRERVSDVRRTLLDPSCGRAPTITTRVMRRS